MRNIILSLLLLFSVSLAAKESLETKVKSANDLYKKGQYENAITVYESLLVDDEESVEVYYNLGNAYYKSGQNAKAILYYEKALLIQPNYEDAAFNLELAQAKNVDKIEKTDVLFLKRSFDGFANILSSNAWAILSVVLFLLCLTLAFVYAFSGIRVYRKVAFFSAIFSLLLSLSSMYLSKIQKDKIVDREYAIIMAPSVTVKSSPDESGTSVFVLHEGTKVKIQSTVEGWSEIKLEDGNVGWIISSDLEKI